MNNNASKHVGIEIIEICILCIMGWKIFNNSFQLTYLNNLLPGDIYLNILMFLGIVKLWYYYKENPRFTVILTLLILIFKFASDTYKIHSMTFYIVVLAIATYKINFAKVCKIFIVSTFVPALIKCVGVFSGVIEDALDEGNMASYRGEFRSGAVLHCLGYGNHNALSLVIFGSSLGLMYLSHNSKWRRLVNASIFVIHGAIYYLSDSRTDFLIIVFILVLDELVSFLKWLSEKNGIGKVSNAILIFVRQCMTWSPTISLAISVILVIYANYCIKFDEYLGGTRIWGGTVFSRFTWAGASLAANGIPFFFQPEGENYVAQNVYNWFSGGQAFFDNDLVWMCAFLFGLPYFILFLGLFQWSALRAYKENNNGALLIITGYALMAFMENIGTSGTRGLVLYMPLAIFSTYKANYGFSRIKNRKNRVITYVAAAFAGFVLIMELINREFILTNVFSLCLFILCMYVFYIWEQVDCYECADN